MTREGKIPESKRERIVLHVKCESVELFIVGAGSRLQDLFESYAIAQVPAPMSIDKIQSVERVKLTEEDFFEVVEEIYSSSTEE